MKTLSTSSLVEECVFATEHEELAAQGIWRMGHTVVSKTTERIANARDQRFGHLHLCLAGEAGVLVGDDWQCMLPGDAYVCPPGASWAWRYRATSEPWRVLFVRFPRSTKPPIPYSCGTSHKIPDVSRVDLLGAFEGLARESRQGGRPTVIRIMAELAVFHVREILGSTAPDPRLARLWNEVTCNLDYKWTIEDMVARTGLRKEMLRRKCLEETGLSPMKHVARLRMRHACHLLVHKRMSLEEVAAAVGYETQFSFSKAFTALMGTRPSSYRKNN